MLWRCQWSASVSSVSAASLVILSPGFVSGGGSAFVPKEVMRGFPRLTPSAAVHQKETGRPVVWTTVICSQGPCWLPYSPLFSEHIQVTV